MASNVKNVTQIEKDHGWFDLKKELKKAKGSKTSIGYFASGGDPSTDLAARAAVHEYGATIKRKSKIIKIPKRPFMRQTFDNNKKKIRNRIVKEYNKILDGEQTVKRGLARLGEWYVGLTKLTVRRGGFVPNTSATIKQKGSSKPLVDTNEMVNALTHVERMK